MRFEHPSGTIVHLACCGNVAGPDPVAELRALARYAESVRRRLAAGPLSLSLWLSPPVAAALSAEPRQLTLFRRELELRGLEVVSLNGVRYAGAVKRDLYAVDWSRPERLAYTLDLARCLARLLPSGAAHGSVSTLPIAWRRPWFPDQEAAATRHMAALPVGLRRLAEDEGRPVRVGFEPAPGCVIERSADAVHWLADLDPDFVGVALDTCHQALAFEDAGDTVRRLGECGVPVVKVRVSGALAVDDPASERVRPALRKLAGTPLLLQVRERSPRGVRGVDDLVEALDGRLRLPARNPWRIHRHLPVHRAPEEPFATTLDAVTGVLPALSGPGAPVTDHIEVEAYTWDPHGGDPVPDPGLPAAELAWVHRRLRASGVAREGDK